MKKVDHKSKQIPLLRILRNGALSILGFLAAYLAIGYFLILVVFPEQKLVHWYIEILPFAPGPPKHIHTRFDETFETAEGVVSIRLNGEVKKLKPGESYFVSRGKPHQPFNETADTLRLKGTIAFPEKFAFGLIQVYGLMDNNPEFDII